MNLQQRVLFKLAAEQVVFAIDFEINMKILIV